MQTAVIDYSPSKNSIDIRSPTTLYAATKTSSCTYLIEGLGVGPVVAGCVVQEAGKAELRVVGLYLLP